MKINNEVYRIVSETDTNEYILRSEEQMSKARYIKIDKSDFDENIDQKGEML